MRKSLITTCFLFLSITVFSSDIGGLKIIRANFEKKLISLGVYEEQRDYLLKTQKLPIDIDTKIRSKIENCLGKSIYLREVKINSKIPGEIVFIGLAETSDFAFKFIEDIGEIGGFNGATLTSIEEVPLLKCKFYYRFSASARINKGSKDSFPERGNSNIKNAGRANSVEIRGVAENSDQAYLFLKKLKEADLFNSISIDLIEKVPFTNNQYEVHFQFSANRK